jgi:hypothetical protein
MNRKFEDIETKENLLNTMRHASYSKRCGAFGKNTVEM